MTRFAAVLLLCGLMFGTAARAAEATLHFRLGEDPTTLYNVNTLSLTANQVMGQYMLERLVYFDASGTPQPWLAASWTVSDDQKVVTFKLRPGIVFSDGTKLDAEAVRAEFAATMDKKNASPGLPFLGSLQTVEAPDSSTVVFTFAKPYAPFFANIAGASFGINSPTALAKYGEKYGRNPVGSGPYMMKSWVPGTEITLVRNPAFHQLRGDAINKGAPYAGTVILTVISEEAVAQAALESGELTAAQLAADALQQVLQNPDLHTVIKKQVTNLYFLEFDESRAPWNDKAMRQAIGAAINRDAIVKAAFNGYASPAFGPLANGIPGYDPKIADEHGMKFDLARAKALLAEAGWKPGPDGKLMKDGKPAEFLMTSYSGFEVVDRTLAMIQSNLADLGITVKTQTSDLGTLYPSLLKPTWDLDLMRWTYSDPSILGILTRSPGQHNATLPEPTLDATLDRCDTIMDQPVRMTCVAEAQTQVMANAVIAPIASDWLVWVTQKNVQDFHLDFFNGLIPGDIRIAD